jgi:hypothetical protein
VTAAEACELLIAQMREVSRARSEREAWRLFALKVLHEYALLTRDQAIADGTHYRRIAACLGAERDELLVPRSERGRAA